jgi:hypothetical protein
VLEGRAGIRAISGKSATLRRGHEGVLAEGKSDGFGLISYHIITHGLNRRGPLSELLAKPGNVAKVEHHAALPYQQVGTFMERDRRAGMSSAVWDADFAADYIKAADWKTARAALLRGSTSAEAADSPRGKALPWR